MTKVNSTTHPTNTFWMLADEFAQIYGERPSASPTAPDIVAGANLPPPATPHQTAREKSDADLKNLYRDFHAEPAYPRTALCLSGGGIRSAAFALGVMQFLAKADLLHRFEYLSTVSGGGYIGSWLSAWFTRAVDAQGKGGYATIGPKLAGRDMPEREPREIDSLRANSNYLTPKLGALSADTWSALAIWLRNLLVNWFLLIPLLAAAAVTPQIVSAIAGGAQGRSWAIWVQLAGILSYWVSLAVFNGGRPRWQSFNLNQRNFLLFSLLFLLAGAVLWAISLANPSDIRFALLQLAPSFLKGNAFQRITEYVVLALILYLLALAVAYVTNWLSSRPFVRVRSSTEQTSLLRYSFELSRATKTEAEVEVYTEDHQAVAGKHYVPVSKTIRFAPGRADTADTLDVTLTGEKIDNAAIGKDDLFIKFRKPRGIRIGGVFGLTRLLDAAAFLISGVCFGVLIAAGDYLFRLPEKAQNPSNVVSNADVILHGLIVTTAAVPWLLLSHALATVIFVAITSWLPRSDEEREWIGRAAGWYLVMAILWALIAGLVLLLPILVVNVMPAHADPKKIVTALISALSASGILTAVLGGSPKTPAVPGSSPPGWRRLALYVGAPVFLVSLFIGLALAVDELALGGSFVTKLTNTPADFWDTARRLALFGLVPAGISALIGFAININRFSLHEMYRNRLVRAFLGASNTDSTDRDRFSFFNFTDNLPASRLWIRRNEKPPGNPPGPKPTLAKADWRPFHILNIALNVVDTDKPAWQERKAESFTVSPLWCGSAQLNAYRRTSEYGGQEPITLGTAMAISGAAVSPNMGYNSSPLITFLLTLFNVRLGWWLGNPLRSGFANDGPWLPVAPLLIELFGLTNDRRKYVYLTDGGHFENLGLYEMVRRRCHLIILSDAGQDKDLTFADLSNAVRKISIDLGVRIEFPNLKDLRIRNAERDDPDKGGPCYTVGYIRYSEADHSPREKDGYILYLKPGFRGDESADIIGYAADSKDFPHETTVDQWFSESQFESYRHLGFTIMERAYGSACENFRNGNPGKTAEDFRALSLLDLFKSFSKAERTDEAGGSL